MDNKYRCIIVVRGELYTESELGAEIIKNLGLLTKVGENLNFTMKNATYIFFESNELISAEELNSFLMSKTLLKYTHDARKYALEEIVEPDRDDFESDEEYEKNYVMHEDYLSNLATGVSDGNVTLIQYNLETEEFEVLSSDTDASGDQSESLYSRETYTLKEYKEGYGDSVKTAHFIYNSFAFDYIKPDEREELLVLVESLIRD